MKDNRIYCYQCSFFEPYGIGDSGECGLLPIPEKSGSCLRHGLCRFSRDNMPFYSVLKALHVFQKWRRGGNGNMPHPYICGIAIDNAMRLLRKNR